MLIYKIEEYLKTHTISELERYSGISQRTLNRLIKNKNWRFYRSTLDCLYDFFKIEKDELYYENFKKWYPKTPSLFWNFVRNKRLWENKCLEELAKEIKVNRRAISRLEAWESQPWYNSWTISNLFESLKFTEEEKEVTKNFIKAIKQMESLVKKTEI